MKNKSFKVALALSIIVGIAESIYCATITMVAGDNFIDWLSYFIEYGIFYELVGKSAMFLFVYFSTVFLEIAKDKKELKKSVIINTAISIFLGIVAAIPSALYVHSLDMYFGPLNCAPWVAALLIYCLSFNALTTITEKRQKN